jgi:hypothetical protein
MMLNGGDFNMGMGDVKTGKLIYHLTELNNLDSILEHGLLSRKEMIEKELIFEDIADQEIISKRKQLGLDDYVPFHFQPYSSFDKAVKSTYSDSEFIYICVSRELARHNKFKILATHPTSAEASDLYEYDEGLANIDWDAMHTMGTENTRIKHIKMAECLTNLIIPGDCFQCIYVSNKKTKAVVQEKLKAKGSINPPYVDEQKWF